MGKEKAIIVRKTWRSELKLFFWCVVLSIATTYLSREYPATVIGSKLFTIGNTAVVLKLPLLWLLAVAPFLVAIIKIYNVKYIIDKRGIESRVGILSTNHRVTRVRFDHIRSVETDATLIERILGIGNIEIATAATGKVEIIMEGVAAPEEIQDMILRECEIRSRLKQGEKSENEYKNSAQL